MFLHLLLWFGRHCRHAFSRVGRKYIFSAVLSASLERFEMALQRSKPFEFLHERGWGSDDDIHGLVTSRDFAFISSLHFVRDGFMKYLQNVYLCKLWIDCTKIYLNPSRTYWFIHVLCLISKFRYISRRFSKLCIGLWSLTFWGSVCYVWK
jgi:hypothetical protein